MAGTVICFLARDRDINAKPEHGVLYSAGYRHDGPGLCDARRWATEHSAAGRDLVVVEMVDGKETSLKEHFRAGKQV